MLMVWMALNSCSPPKYTLYLGADTNTRFDKDIVSTNNYPACPFMSFLGYGNYNYRVLDSNFDAKNNMHRLFYYNK
jgi:hypothetical protein